MDQREQPSAPVRLAAAELSGCRHRVHLDHTEPHPSLLVDPGIDRRREQAAAHRRRVAAALAAQAVSWVHIPAQLPTAARRELTAQAVASGVERIWGATLPGDPARRGRVELLQRHETGYLPVLVVNHRTTDPGSGAWTSGLYHWAPRPDPERSLRPYPRDQLRLAHLTRMLQAAGFAAGRHLGGVIGLDADCILVHDLDAPSWPGGRSSLTEYDARFADRWAVATGAAPTRPSRIGECRSCPWWPRCHSELQRARDVSLVVTGVQATMLHSLGTSTVDQLAESATAAPPGWPGTSYSDAVVLAKAWRHGARLVRRKPAVHIHRADVEVDVDMESYFEQGAYLWGALLTAPGVPMVYRAFVSWDPLPTPDEARSFAEFWTWLMAVRTDALAHGKTFAAYCYSEAAENRWLLASARRFAGAAGVPTEEQVLEFIGSDQWVDVYAAIDAAFLCPLGKGLKKIAPLAGFSWRDPEAGGEASMGWYRRAVGLDGEADLGQRQRLLDYNADDVWATKVLREWMSERAVHEVPLAADL